MINKFKDNLKCIRAEMGITQSEVSRLTDIPSAVISFYETGERKPGLDNIISLCNGLKCSADELLGIDKIDTK